MRLMRTVLLAGAAACALPAVAAAQVTQPGGPSPSGDRSVQPSTTDQGEIIVTATRRNERLSRVPISVSAFSNEKLEQLNVKSFQELAKFTPGIQYDEARHDIAIRGISSQAGTGTTGIYIDDTPIQVRALGLNANNTLPNVFDLDRVEVLRGPQGTLFGAGSEGGTVRYITPQPSLTKYSGIARIEASGVEHGSPNYEGGVALGGPIVTDHLGFRLSAWYRRDGGYINRVDYQTLKTTERDANYVDTYVLRGALAWQPVSALTITPSVFYQNRRQHNYDNYWVGISHIGSGNFLNGTPDRQADNDKFVLPALKADLTAGPVRLISNTSYYDRREIVGGYSGTLYNYSLLQQLLTNTNPDGSAGQNFNLDPVPGNPTLAASQAGYPLLTQTGINNPAFPNYLARVFITNQQQNFTQEVRIQNRSADDRLQYVLGVFYDDNRQLSQEEIRDPELPQLIPLLFGEDFLTFTEGVPLLANGDSYINRSVGHDSQTALFGDVTFALTPQLKLSAGVRYAWTRFSFTNLADGPQNVGQSTGAGAKRERPVTPKFNVSWQVTPDDLLYATVSKGFRIGGANPPFPAQLCSADLTRLGNPDVGTYKSDSVWNYEGGFKVKALDRKLTLAASGYHLDWSNIQQAIYLTSCGFQFTGNLGSVQSNGFDAQASFNPVRAISIDVAIGYTDARFSKSTITTQKGDTVPGVVPWTLSLGAQYSFKWRDHDSFVRSDYQFASRNPYLTPEEDVRNAVNDPSLVNDPATNQLALRGGVTFGKVEAQLFVENLLDEHPQLALNHQDQYTLLFEAQTLRPRTWGMALAYRY